jgi:hypothetical protein
MDTIDYYSGCKTTEDFERVRIMLLKRLEVDRCMREIMYIKNPSRNPYEVMIENIKEIDEQRR